MKITLITVGKIKEKYLKDAIAEYSKRLSRYCKLEIVEVADEKTPDNASDTVEDAIRDKEGERIQKYIKEVSPGPWVPPPRCLASASSLKCSSGGPCISGPSDVPLKSLTHPKDKTSIHIHIERKEG